MQTTLVPGIIRKHQNNFYMLLYNNNYEVIGLLSCHNKRQLKRRAEGLKTYLVNTPIYSLN